MDASAGLGIFGLAASIGVGLIFASAGITKLRHRALLAAVVANYRILPRRLVAPMALVLPYGEIALGAALIAALGTVPALAGIALLLAFAAAMAVNIRRGRMRIDCGCGLSHLRQHLGWPLVARNLLLALLLALRFIPSTPLSGVEVAAGAVGGVALFLCTLIFNAIGALSQSSAAAFRRHA